MIKKIGNQWCVVHAHAQKSGSATDKPAGTPIACFPFKEGNKQSENVAKMKAQGLHYAIVSKQKKDSK